MTEPAAHTTSATDRGFRPHRHLGRRLCALLVTGFAIAAAPAGAVAASAPVVALSFADGGAGLAHAPKSLAPATGRFGRGISLKAGTALRLPRSQALATARRITLEAWIHPASARGKQVLIAVRGRHGARFGLQLRSRRLVAAGHRGRTTVAARGKRVAARRWRFVAATFDGRRLRVYVGGKRVAQRRVRGRLMPVGGRVQLGGGRFRGAIDNVRVYRRALSRAALRADAARDITGRPEDGAGAGGGAAPAPTAPGGKPSLPPSDGKHCMADPSACGYPDVENTGVLPGVARDTVGGDVTLSTAGQLFANKTVNGSITVQADNVTIRNVKVNGGQIFIKYGSAYAGLVVEDTEIDMGGNLDTRGILYGNYSARRIFIHNGSDCAQLDYNVAIRDSLCVLGPDGECRRSARQHELLQQRPALRRVRVRRRQQLHDRSQHDPQPMRSDLGDPDEHERRADRAGDDHQQPDGGRRLHPVLPRRRRRAERDRHRQPVRADVFLQRRQRRPVDGLRRSRRRQRQRLGRDPPPGRLITASAGCRAPRARRGSP